MKLTLLLIHICCATVVAAQEPKTSPVQFLFEFPGEPVSGLALSEPHAIAIDDKGTIYLADTGNNRVLKFDKKGRFLDIVGGFGWRQEEFDRPVDLSARSLLDVFIVDFNNERIERYDRDLNYISSLHSDENTGESRQFGFPVSVDISKHGELFICDSESDRILKLNSFGTAVLSFGDFNEGEGRLQSPAHIEVTDEDLVYVSDDKAGEIVVFDYYGNFVRRLGSQILAGPAGLTWRAGRLYVTDVSENQVVVFDKTDRVVAAWGARSALLGGFDQPVDVAVFEENIYVLDSNNGRVQVFHLLEPSLE